MRINFEQLFRSIHKHLVFRTIVMVRGEGAVFRHLNELRALQYCDEATLLRRQDLRLKRILQLAGTQVPYYVHSWGNALALNNQSGYSALQQLPILSKAELQGRFLSLRSLGGPLRVTRKTTGGSTGQAVTVLKDRDALAREMAATHLAHEWFGVRIGDRSARFWGTPQTRRRRLRARAVRIAVRRMDLSAFAFNDDDLEQYWQRCIAFKPRFLYGYVSMLEAFAGYLQRQDYDARRLGLKSVITTSEVLGEPQRRLLEDVFGVPVQNEYGCGETGPIAYECERGSLHVVAENLIVEILRDDGSPTLPGESGQIVLTDLNNIAMPLIRYRVGDFAVWGDACDCGRAWPVLQRIWGRSYDFVQGTDGRRYHGEYFMYMFEDLRDTTGGVRQFQVTQLSADRIDVAIVPEIGKGDAAVSAVLRMFNERLPGIFVDVRIVTDIARSPSGKLRLIRNLWLSPSTEESNHADLTNSNRVAG